MLCYGLPMYLIFLAFRDLGSFDCVLLYDMALISWKHLCHESCVSGEVSMIIVVSCLVRRRLMKYPGVYSQFSNKLHIHGSWMMNYFFCKMLIEELMDFVLVAHIFVRWGYGLHIIQKHSFIWFQKYFSITKSMAELPMNPVYAWCWNVTISCRTL